MANELPNFDEIFAEFNKAMDDIIAMCDKARESFEKMGEVFPHEEDLP